MHRQAGKRKRTDIAESSLTGGELTDVPSGYPSSLQSFPASRSPSTCLGVPLNQHFPLRSPLASFPSSIDQPSMQQARANRCNRVVARNRSTTARLRNSEGSPLSCRALPNRPPFLKEQINALKASFAHRSLYGCPACECMQCHALFWREEKGTAPVYNLCCRGALHTVEFQKCCLPHIHALVWCGALVKDPTPAIIDAHVAAEIPNVSFDPLAYILVEEFMLHGPCGEANRLCPCMKDGCCSKPYPKEFRNETLVDDDGFALYRRRNDGRAVLKNGTWLDNRFVVLHNLFSLKKYQAHINVEWCNKTRMIKYLFKYITKGHDNVRVQLTSSTARTTSLHAALAGSANEIQAYLDCRYLSAHEAIWRLFEYDIHCRTPAVERLPVHLPNMQSIVFEEQADLRDVISNDSRPRTKLAQWL